MSRTSTDFSSDPTTFPPSPDPSHHMIPSDRPRKGLLQKPPSTHLNRMNSTIRTVRSFETVEQPRLSEDSATTEGTVQSQPQSVSVSASRDSAFSSSIASSNASYMSSSYQSPQPPPQQAAGSRTLQDGPADDGPAAESSPNARLIKQSASASAVAAPIPSFDGSPKMDGSSSSSSRRLVRRLSASTAPQREGSVGGRSASTHSSRDGRLAEQPPGSSSSFSSGAATVTNGINNNNNIIINGTNGLGGTGGGGGSSNIRSKDDLSSASATEAQLANGAWDSTVGKAGLGKTGRVINRLVSDNEALKRDIQIERLRAEEAKQAARLVEDRMERMAADYEGRLFEASIAKTMLTRKEHQVESLQAAVELERRRAADAVRREDTRKGELDQARADAQRRVDESAATAALMEGRYNAISSHWRDQGADAQRTVRRVRADVDALRDERRRDDERIQTLRDLCDQQDGNIRDLTRQRDDMAARFEAYKREQEAALAGIKTAADEREREQARMLAEAREVLDKLRWALNVKENVKWAQ